MSDHHHLLTNIFLLFFLVFLFCSLSHASSPQNISALALDTGTYSCFPDIPTYFISFADCLIARTALPYSTAADQFHAKGRDDAFRLPKFSRHRTCAIQVTFRAGSELDTGAWREVRELVGKIMRDCAVPRRGHLTRGGSDIMGYNERILVGVNRAEDVGMAG